MQRLLISYVRRRARRNRKTRPDDTMDVQHGTSIQSSLCHFCEDRPGEAGASQGADLEVHPGASFGILE